MPDLIPLSMSTVGSETIQTVNARDLHAFLTVGTDFRHWILRRIDAYHFEEDRDFTTVTSAQGPVRTIEYHVSLDMAKELAMVERTDKGKEARQYFLACERRALQPPPPLLPRQSLGEQLATIDQAITLFQRLGGTERDRLMLLDWGRNTVLAAQPRIGPGPMRDDPPVPHAGFSTAERCAQLGYQLTRAQEAALYPQLGKVLAKEWRDRHAGEEPEKDPRFVDGALRKVSWFPQEAADWVDPMIQAFFAGYPGIDRQAQP